MHFRLDNDMFWDAGDVAEYWLCTRTVPMSKTHDSEESRPSRIDYTCLYLELTDRMEDDLMNLSYARFELADLPVITEEDEPHWTQLGDI